MLDQRHGITQTPPPIRIDLPHESQSVLDLVSEGLMNKEIARRSKQVSVMLRSM
jgi:DNA-binding NarL/FixJ family response regulator